MRRLAGSGGAVEDSGAITSIDLAAHLYYDVDTGSAITPYVGVGVGGGLSHFEAPVTAAHDRLNVDTAPLRSRQLPADAGP